MHQLQTDFPVLDINAVPGTSEYRKLVSGFLDTYSTIGFGAIVNHGIAPDTIKAVFNASRQFHALPLAKKNEYALDKNHRGYIAINTSTDVNSTLEKVTRPNQSASFMVMREDTPDSEPVVQGAYLAGPNQWPELDGFKESVNTYINEAVRVVGKLIGVTADALQCSESTLKVHFNPPTLWFRLLHYPPSATNAPDDLYGSAPHTDFGVFTLLLQDDIGGLQVLHPNGEWLDVPCIPGALIVNVGDMLHRLSNGLLRSTPHRVINRNKSERYSCALFYDPYTESVISPIDECVSNYPPVKYGELHFGDFLRNELSASYETHKGIKKDLTN